ncbi:MAG: TniQ family protein, partial [Candidatus Thiodiazotropha sp. (ex Lucinoma kastoroae)]|nr:TniQ family protein [Candidatus Thiodiazotropha sp. (ex Lucinoma kastoroae)]
ACLAEDLVPYYRKQWRIAVFTYCPLHQIELHDACPCCEKPIVFYRMDFGRDVKDILPISSCYVCGYDLRESERRPVEFPSNELHKMYDEVLNYLSDSKNASRGFDVDFFNVLHQLCKIMGMKKTRVS